MLSLTQDSDRLRRADNLLPRPGGRLASRPGAQQIMTGQITHAQPWGSRIVAYRDGRLTVWDGTELQVGFPSTGHLQGTSFQALTSSSARTDRFYGADGKNPLWYLHRRTDNGVYALVKPENELLDQTSEPYDMPIPDTITTWQNRLWVGFGTNRVQHSDFERPHYWDPLWTVECQDEQPGGVSNLTATNEALLVGLRHSTWAVTGTSQFNFQRDQVFSEGAIGRNAMVETSNGIYLVSESGLFLLGRGAPLSDDLRKIFLDGVGVADLVIDKTRRVLLMLVASRVFSMHIDEPGSFGEVIAGAPVAGLIQTDDFIGWYGDDGLWALHGDDTPDIRLDGVIEDVRSVFQTWDTTPNVNGNRRALCNRVRLKLRGSSRANASYSIDVDGQTKYTRNVSLTDQTVPGWNESGTAVGLSDPVRPVVRELVPRAAGGTFRHTLEAACHMEVLHFEPEYRYREDTE